jgi:hypothetical protein
MADNDSNTIKPVESLQNIPVLTPAKRREQGKRRSAEGGRHKGNKEHSELEQDSLADEPRPLEKGLDEQDLDVELTENEDDQSASGGIDYCA